MKGLLRLHGGRDERIALLYDIYDSRAVRSIDVDSLLDCCVRADDPWRPLLAQLLSQTLLCQAAAEPGELHVNEAGSTLDDAAFKRAFEHEPLLSRLLLSVLPRQCTAGLAACDAGVWPDAMDWAALFDLWSEMHPAPTLDTPALALPALSEPQARLFWSTILSRHPVLQERCLVLSGRELPVEPSAGADVPVDARALWSTLAKAMHRDQAVRLRFVFDVLDIDVRHPCHPHLCQLG